MKKKLNPTTKFQENFNWAQEKTNLKQIELYIIFEKIEFVVIGALKTLLYNQEKAKISGKLNNSKMFKKVDKILENPKGEYSKYIRKKSWLMPFYIV